MSRTPDLSARQDLLDRVIDYLAEHGLGDATLRPLAASLSTTPTRLMHHFGSKAELLAAALQRTEQLQQQIEAHWVARNPQMTYSDVLRGWWKWMLASKKNLNRVRLGLEAATLNSTVTGLPGDVRADQIGAWRANIERRLLAMGLSASQARIESSVVKAAFTGLTLDLVASGERRRLSDALEVMLAASDQRIAAILAETDS